MLVRRSSCFHGLTPEGKKVLDWARHLVGDAAAMRQELRAMRTGLSGHLRIAVIPTAVAMVPVLTGPCLARHSNSATSAGVQHVKYTGPLLWTLVQAAQPVDDPSGGNTALQHTEVAGRIRTGR